MPVSTKTATLMNQTARQDKPLPNWISALFGGDKSPPTNTSDSMSRQEILQTLELLGSQIREATSYVQQTFVSRFFFLRTGEDGGLVLSQIATRDLVERIRLQGITPGNLSLKYCDSEGCLHPVTMTVSGWSAVPGQPMPQGAAITLSADERIVLIDPPATA